jgi:DNA invertase Pin-like site-specific DNA recombinase
MLSLTTFADELEREKARQRTYDAMVRKARAGHVTGGRVFGYENLRRDTGGVCRVVNEAEAEIVREIFTRYAHGQGFRAIAFALNAVGAPSPRAQQSRPSGWCPSSVREVLNRPLYRGEIVWNRTKKRNQWGQQQQKARPETDWLRLPAPELRIVSEAAWSAAHERLTGC